MCHRKSSYVTWSRGTNKVLVQVLAVGNFESLRKPSIGEGEKPIGGSQGIPVAKKTISARQILKLDPLTVTESDATIGLWH